MDRFAGDRGDQLRRLRVFQHLPAVRQIGGTIAGQPQRCENAAYRLQRYGTLRTGVIGPLHGDPGTARKIENGGVIHHEANSATVEYGSSRPARTARQAVSEQLNSSRCGCGGMAAASAAKLLASTSTMPSPIRQRASTAAGPTASASSAWAPSRRGTISLRRSDSRRR